MSSWIQNENKIRAPKSLKTWKGDIELREVRLTYGAEGELVLKGINLIIPKGKTIALVGHSGSGKTSLIRLL
ncbi:MAG: ATP-binding cassette domain-containing protein, partial [Gammaproteobacteria bacterium]|nr:ATP-binding cassette domain-containing protein [Gammaproteobacteria bacterium]